MIATMLDLWRRCDAEHGRAGRETFAAYEPLRAALAVTGPIYRIDDATAELPLVRWAGLQRVDHDRWDHPGRDPGAIEFVMGSGRAGPGIAPGCLAGAGTAREAAAVPMPTPGEVAAARRDRPEPAINPGPPASGSPVHGS
jgi:hypothetical protein